MTHISRPFQAVLVVFALFVVVWFAALRDHNASTGAGGGSGAPVAQSVRPATHATSTHATSSTPAHASTAGKTGAKAADARTRVVHTSRHATTAVHTAHGQTAVVHTTVHKTVVVHTAPTTRAPAHTSSPAPAKSASPEEQVESQLKAGKTVLILFWNPHGAEDVAVHGELPAVERKLGGKVAVHYASASQVGEYGTVTHAVQVNQTPTLLIVNPHGQTTVLTGLNDAFGIEQAIRESA